MSPPTDVCMSHIVLQLIQREPMPPGLLLGPGKPLAYSHMTTSACSDMRESRGGKEIYGKAKI